MRRLHFVARSHSSLGVGLIKLCLDLIRAGIRSKMSDVEKELSCWYLIGDGTIGTAYSNLKG